MKLRNLILSIPLIASCGVLHPTINSQDIQDGLQVNEWSKLGVSKEQVPLARMHAVSLHQLSNSIYIEKKNVESYLQFLDQGIPIATLAKITHKDFATIKKYAKTETIPTEIFRNSDLLAYEATQKWAREQPEYATNTEELKDNLIQRLSRKEHVDRLDFKTYTAMHDESYQQINTIQNKELLTIIANYVDFFEKPETYKLIKELMLTTDEQGGFIVPEGDAYQFIQLQSTKNKKESYNPSPFEKYSRHIGILHTHPILDARNDHLLVAGPSKGDIHTTSEQAQFYNPYLVDVVATELPGHKYNIDITVIDVPAHITGTQIDETHYRNNRRIIDIGVISK